MSLPAPNLDDRRFQDLVDDAKRLVQQRCPEWTDHNVSDPGVTLIEAFAQMTDQLLYRLNRVPERHYVKFLELIGVELFPPTAATVDVTFRLSAPQSDTVHIPPGTEVATVQSEVQTAVVFTTTRGLALPSVERNRVLTRAVNADHLDHSVGLDAGAEFFAFSQVPQPGDAMLVGLSEAAPRCAVSIAIDCDVDGIGVDPSDPPLRWEAWTGDEWLPCELESDGTGAFNRRGEVILHVPDGHETAIMGGQRGAWLRCLVEPARAGQPAYTASPVIRSVTASVVGGTTSAVNAEIVTDEVIGLGDGTPGQRFQLQRTPVVPGAGALRIEVANEEGWQSFEVVESFAGSGPEDKHCTIDYVNGQIQFGPMLRLADGTVHHHGAAPGQGQAVRIREYLTGGGRAGNVARNTVQVMKTSIPYINRVTNRRAAQGGVDGETLENAKTRGPIMLRTRDRAVTAEDFEHITREAAPELARVRCVTPTGPEDSGGVRVLVVPSVATDRGRIDFGQLIPAEQTMRKITEHLDQRRIIGTRVIVEPPLYQGVTIVARVRSAAGAETELVEERSLEALYNAFNPFTGEGVHSEGWPFGRAIGLGDVYSVLQQVEGVNYIVDVRLFAADPVTGERGDAVQQINVDANSLAFSFDHQILVEEGE